MPGSPGSSVRTIGRSSNGRLNASATAKVSATAGAAAGSARRAAARLIHETGAERIAAASCGPNDPATASGPTRPRRSAWRVWASAMWHSPTSTSTRVNGSLDPGRQAERDQSEQHDFERLKILEIRAAPLDERGLQRRHRHQPERLDQAGDAVRRRKRGGEREAANRPQRRASMPARPGQHRLRREVEGEQQARTKSCRADWPTAPSAVAAEKAAPSPRRAPRTARPTTAPATAMPAYAAGPTDAARPSRRRAPPRSEPKMARPSAAKTGSATRD